MRLMIRWYLLFILLYGNGSGGGGCCVLPEGAGVIFGVVTE